MPFQDPNILAGLSPSSRDIVGRVNSDNDQVVEKGALLPWPADPACSYVYYECAIMAVLDNGIVVHNRLPQVDRAADTLATTSLDDPNLDLITNAGINLRCQDQYQDIVQRMGHARYWFRIWGQALRVGYQVPIPAIRSIGGVPPIPYDRNPQWAINRISPGSNYSGVPLWLAQWSLWYTTAVPPVTNNIPAADPSAHISSSVPLPQSGVQSPYSASDDNAEATGLEGFFVI